MFRIDAEKSAKRAVNEKREREIPIEVMVGDAHMSKDRSTGLQTRVTLRFES
jgi:hypothetical protein